MSIVKTKPKRVVNPSQKLEETLRTLRTLMEADPSEQAETFAYLEQVIDEDRPTRRKRFLVS